MINLFEDIETALLNKKFENGLSSYTQRDCQVTLTDEGYHIYRPPNIIFDNDNYDKTSTMWGGLKIECPHKNGKPVLQKNHTYIVLIDIKGKSSNAIYTHGWTNQMGWGGGGLSPKPSNTSRSVCKSDFDINDVYYYKWTITDDIYKVCTETYSGFVEGETYLSYRHFQLGFTYQNTGEWGTNIYLNNFRLYDITDIPNSLITQSGNAVFTSFNESVLPPPSKIYQSGDIYTQEIIEF